MTTFAAGVDLAAVLAPPERCPTCLDVACRSWRRRRHLGRVREVGAPGRERG